MEISMKAFEAYKIKLQEKAIRESEMLERFGVNKELSTEAKEAIQHYVETGKRSRIFKNLTK